MIGLIFKDAANFCAFFYAISCVIYWFPHSGFDSKLKYSHQYCQFRMHMVNTSSLLVYPMFTMFYNIRAWGIVNDPKVTKYLNENAKHINFYKNCLKISIVLTIIRATIATPLVCHIARESARLYTVYTIRIEIYIYDKHI